jgi:P4 family phage/plasmid primase-like protien
MSAQRSQEPFLSDKHRTELHDESAIDPKVRAARRYETITRPTPGDSRSRERLEKLGFPEAAIDSNGKFPALLIPMYAPSGERVSYQLKPNVPWHNSEGKPQKYASPKRQPPKVDVHPSNRDKIKFGTEELWITEGIKKGDSLTSQGVCVATLTGVFNWRNRLATLGDWEDVLIKGRVVTVNFDHDALTNPNVLNAMHRCVNWLKHKGALKVYYLVTPGEYRGVKTKGADDYFAAGGTLEELVSHRTTIAPSILNATDTFSDARLAETIADEVLVDSYHWIASLGWQKWTGKVWADCSDVTVGESVRQYSLSRFAAAAAALQGPNGDPRAISGWQGMLSAGKERSVLSLARGIVERSITDLDADPDLLNAQNGVVDLATSELYPHDPSRLMTKIAGAEYRQGYEHRDWKQALQALPDEIRDWYQVRIGQAITGHMTPDDRLVIAQGGGSNGKSTVNIGTARAAGSYYLLVSDRVLLANPDQHPTELMDLKGVRYAVAEETPEARRLAVSRLKKTIGTPEITARKIHKDSVTFRATHSFFLSTNYRPMVEETDPGTWRRLCLVRFPFTFRPTQEDVITPDDLLGDPNLRARCEANPDVWAAALTWMVEGARKWYENDRIMPALPDRVEAETYAWREESDQVLCYIGERLKFDVEAVHKHVAAMDLLDDINAWLTARGHRPWSDKTLAARFGDHDAVTTRSVKKRKVRKSDAVSRPYTPPSYDSYQFSDPWRKDTRPGSEPLPATYAAWTGVRFATDEEETPF